MQLFNFDYNTYYSLFFSFNAAAMYMQYISKEIRESNFLPKKIN